MAWGPVMQYLNKGDKEIVNPFSQLLYVAAHSKMTVYQTSDY